VRGTLATIFDGLFPSNAARGVKPQVLFDMLLFELDRGIDLLALGSGESEGGPTEWRAIALWAIVQVILNVLTGEYVGKNVKWWKNPGNKLIGGPIHDLIMHPDPSFKAELGEISKDITTATKNVPGLDQAFKQYQTIDLAKIPQAYNGIKPTDKNKANKCLLEELRVQLTLEQRWEKLVSTIAIETGDQSQVFGLLKMVIQQAAYDVINVDPLKIDMVDPLPPQFEQSLLTIAKKVT
jgi:hypothetical protein